MSRLTTQIIWNMLKPCVLYIDINPSFWYIMFWSASATWIEFSNTGYSHGTLDLFVKFILEKLNCTTRPCQTLKYLKVSEFYLASYVRLILLLTFIWGKSIPKQHKSLYEMRNIIHGVHGRSVFCMNTVNKRTFRFIYLGMSSFVMISCCF